MPQAPIRPTITPRPERLANKEAKQHFAQKSLLTSARHYDVLAYEHALAFTVAGMMQQDLLQDTYQLLQQAITEGLPFHAFKKQLLPELIKKGWLAKDFASSDDGTLDKTAQKDYQHYLGRRLKTIYHTNKQTAYAAGQWQRIQRNKAFLPYLQYMPSPSTKQRDDHKIYYGLVRPVDDPIWEQIYPPNGFGCKCWVKQLTRRQAETIGISDPLDLETREIKNPHTGQMIATSQGVHFSFNHNHDRLTALLKLAQEKHGTSFAATLAGQVVSMDNIAQLFLADWLGDGVSEYQALFVNKLAPTAAKYQLDISEFMALRHYTEAGEALGYRELNALLNQSTAIDWRHYLALMSAQHTIDQALQKMPVFRGVVTRTANFPKRIIERLITGTTVDFRGLTSSTHRKQPVAPDGSYNTILTIKSKNGRLIEEISRFKSEQEVLFPSFTTFFVKSVEQVNGVNEIVLEEL